MGALVSGCDSRLDAFSGSRVRTWLPGGAAVATTGPPAVRPARSSRTGASPPQRPDRPRRIETELSHDVLNPARVPLSWANSPTLGTFSSPRMRRADIEVPNPAVDVDSWAGSACYPRGSFYPLSHGPSTRHRGITRPDFRPCPARRPRSQAPLLPLRAPAGSIRPEGTVGRLRYPLGGDRPSQTPRQPRSPAGFTGRGEDAGAARVVFQRRLRRGWRPGLAGSHLSYTGRAPAQRQAGVKLHGVFLSCRGSAVSSPPLQFRRVPRRDSAQIVLPFVRVGTYPTRNFATLGPL